MVTSKILSQNSSLHLFLGLPLGLVPSNSPVSNFSARLPILSITLTCQSLFSPSQPPLLISVVIYI